MENHSLLVLLGQAQYVLKAIGVLMVEATTAKDLGYCDDSHGISQCSKENSIVFYTIMI